MRRILNKVGFALFLCVTAQAASRPNIILIMVDDMGWSDIGCYGSEIETPNLDTLAENGIRFRQFYNTSKCYPSRACLLTGVYAHQNGLRSTSNAYLRNSVTIGEVLSASGYHTYVSGKHHGLDNLFNRGFDHYYGLRDGACNHFNPGLQRAGEPAPAQKGTPREWCDDALLFSTLDAGYQNYFPTNFYSTDFFTDKALEYLTEWDAQDSGHPFFLYLSYTAPHDPLMAWPDDIEKYEGVYEVGYEAIRTNRYQKQLDLGLVNTSQHALSPPTHQDWNSLSTSDQADQARRMQVYAAMVDRVDQKIGELMTRLQAMGIYDDTLILFCADNGSSDERTSTGDTSAEIGGLERYASLLQHWANVGNTPFRYYKNDSDEGGIRTPLVVHWPNGIVNPGRFTDHRGHLIDFMATFIDLSGADYPRFYNGTAVTPLEGESFSDVLFDQATTNRAPLFFEWRTGQAVIDGDYKLVSRNNGSSWTLHNMATDATELNDLSSSQSEKRTELLNKYSSWFTSVNGNILPKAADDSAGGSFSMSVDINVLANDSDSDGTINASTLEVVQHPHFGSVSINPDDTIRYTPGTAIVQTDHFSYRVKDNDGAFSNDGFVSVNFAPDSTAVSNVVMEAEDATLFGAVVQDNRPGASGGEFINFNPNNPPDYVEWQLTASSAITVDLMIRYANGSPDIRSLELRVNDVVLNPSLPFAQTATWDTWETVEVNGVSLQPGSNTIRMTTPVDTDGPNLDMLQVDFPVVSISVSDSDSDGMPDWFEDLFVQLDKNNPNDAGLDADGDGETNRTEFEFNTDLLDAGSSTALRIKAWVRDEMNLSWNALPGMLYSAESSTNLVDWTAEDDSTPSSDAGSLWVSPKAPSSFYRIFREPQ